MKKALVLWSFLVSFLIFVALLTGHFANLRQVQTGDASLFDLRPDDQELVSQGGDLYAEYCASCHGADLKGEPNWQTEKPDGSLPAPPHDETGHTWHHSDDLLFRTTKFGTANALGLETFDSNMPAFGESLSDEEIVAVLSWIKAQWPAEIRQRHDTLNQRVQDKKQ